MFYYYLAIVFFWCHTFLTSIITVYVSVNSRCSRELLYVPNFYIPKVLYSEGSMFRKYYKQQQDYISLGK